LNKNKTKSSKDNKIIKMVVYGVYVVSKSGGLIFNHDHSVPRIESEKTFSFPLDIKVEFDKKNWKVVFGQRDGIFGKL
jgi:trafficking protein particle complex subunit 4